MSKHIAISAGDSIVRPHRSDHGAQKREACMVAFKPGLDGTLTIGADDILSSRPENLTGRDEPR